MLRKAEKLAVNAPVTRTGNGDSWMLHNGIVQATLPELTAGRAPATFASGKQIDARPRQQRVHPQEVL
jgi:hypothetical protein